MRIRVYNVGFGESILIDLPRPDSTRCRILIDCGSVSFADSGQNHELLVNRIMADIAGDGGVPRIDVVVATHRHRDHISGFAHERWRNVEVGEVWQPWTEDPTDPQAGGLRTTQNGLANAIVANIPRLQAAHGIDPRTVELVHDMGFNAQSNDTAVATLRSGFAGRPKRRYLARLSRAWLPPLLGGIPVHVLGPSRDVDAIARMDPPTGQSYLALLPPDSAAAISSTPLDMSPPDVPPADVPPADVPPADVPPADVPPADVPPDDVPPDDMPPDDVPPDDVPPAPTARDDRPFPWLPAMTYGDYGHADLNGGTPRKVDHGFAKGQLRKLVVSDSLLTATMLDHALNNTSLVLGFEIGDQMLLFVGDAQWGSWQQSLDDESSAEVLRRATFYKVGHHGSHNATPRRFVEECLRTGAQCVASVGRYSRWENIPRRELLDALAETTHLSVVTTMEPPSEPSPGVAVEDGGAVIEFTLPVTW